MKYGTTQDLKSNMNMVIQWAHSMAFEDLGVRKYAQWFDTGGFNSNRTDGTVRRKHEASGLVVTALAMQIATMRGQDFTGIGCTLGCAIWLVDNIQSYVRQVAVYSLS